MNTTKIFFSIALIYFLKLSVSAQTQEVTGSVISPYGNQPIEGALISLQTSQESAYAESDNAGKFSLTVSDLSQEITVSAQGFYEQTIPLLGRNELKVFLIPVQKVNYNEKANQLLTDFGNVRTINRKNFKPGAFYIEDVIQTAFPGLYTINKSGMPGEGAYLAYRGVRSIQGENYPLIVVNGVPFIPDLNNSAIIGGYARSVLNGLNVENVENITLLNGADAAVYGSLGSNGVLLIETTRAVDLETKIQYSGQFGISNNVSTIPVLGVDEFKKYIGEVGLTRYEDAAEMLQQFPFLKSDPDYYYKFLYNNNTDWQSEIYDQSFVTANNINVKGGDAIAKYDFSVGFLNQGGTLKNTGIARYNTILNTNINLGKRMEFVSSMGFVYVVGKHQNQGMLEASNPILTALHKAPILNPYQKNETNTELPVYDVYRQFNVSNPLAVVNTVSSQTNAYDLFLNSGLNYKVNDAIKLSALFGLYSGYSRQNGFVPGKTSAAIVPREDGVELNTASAGVGESANIYYNLSGQHRKILGSGVLTSGVGYQGLLTRREFDSGNGRNTNSDFYRTLNYVSTEGASFFGYIDKWTWMNMYGFTSYDYKKILKASATLSYDGSSVSGKDASRFGLFPAVNVTWMAKNMEFLKNVDLVNSLNVNVGISSLGNSRLSSKLGKQYYSGQIYREISGIISNSVANNSLTWETNNTIEAGVSTRLMNNKVTAFANIYRTVSNDIVVPQRISPIYGAISYNANSGEITTNGYELGLQLDVVQTRDFSVTIGGMLSHYESIVTDLGNSDGLITILPDGAELITKKGYAPFSFYGYKTEGIFATSEEAAAAALSDHKQDIFGAGDVHFVDQDQSEVTIGGETYVKIDEDDKTIIGNASPKFFGGFDLNLRYKRLTVASYFQYAVGNETYNALRRDIESVDGFYNQSAAVLRRWKAEGQVTDVPKAVYGDPMKNSRFSDRWIEDASYLRLTNLILNYELKSRASGLIRGGSVFLTAENLFTATNYLGLDPVQSYAYSPAMQGVDYAKQALPRTYKVGFNLLF